MNRRGRRQFLQSGLALAGFGLLAGCGALPPGSQNPARVARIGYLSGQSAEADAPLTGAFQQGLRELGYVEGQNINVEYRYTGGNPERLAEIASDLVGLPLDVLVTQGTSQAIAAKQATDVIPIVFVGGNPVVAGLVSSLARPGGKITGVSIQPLGLNTKSLELVRETLPDAARVAFLRNGGNPASLAYEEELQEVAPAMGIQILSVDVRGPGDIEPGFSAAIKGHADAVIMSDEPFVFTARAQAIGLAADNRLPSMYRRKEYVDDGGLMSYGVRISDSFRRAATYVDKILKGADPGDLPVEQPTSFEFALNLKTAQALGLAIPPSVFDQVTEVIR